MKRFTWLFIVSLILGGAAYAQDNPKVEATGYCSYFRFNPENSGTLSSHSLNGGGGDIGFYFSRMIGVKAEFAGYQDNKVTFTSGSVSASATANLFTYNVGPSSVWRSPFQFLRRPVQDVYMRRQQSKQQCIRLRNRWRDRHPILPLHCLSARAGQLRTYAVWERISSGNQNQSNFRYQAGIQIRF